MVAVSVVVILTSRPHLEPAWPRYCPTATTYPDPGMLVAVGWVGGRGRGGAGRLVEVGDGRCIGLCLTCSARQDAVGHQYVY